MCCDLHFYDALKTDSAFDTETKAINSYEKTKFRHHCGDDFREFMKWLKKYRIKNNNRNVSKKSLINQST